MSYMISIDFRCNEGAAGTFAEMLRAALPETRAFDGCQNLDVYFDEKANTYTIFEAWDSADHYRAYLKYRTDNGIADLVAPVLDGGWDAAVASVKWLGEKTDI